MDCQHDNATTKGATLVHDSGDSPRVGCRMCGKSGMAMRVRQYDNDMSTMSFSCNACGVYHELTKNTGAVLFACEVFAESLRGNPLANLLLEIAAEDDAVEARA